MRIRREPLSIVSEQMSDGADVTTA
jgi:hypothetical protein